MTGEYAGIPAQLRAQHADVQAKFQANVEEGRHKPIDWAARADIQDELAMVCGQIADALWGSDALIAELAFHAQRSWHDVAGDSRQLAERAGGAR